MCLHSCQPCRAYKRSASALAVSRTTSVLPGLKGTTFGSSEKRRPQTLPAAPPMHKHLRDVAAVQLILGLSQDDLRGADCRACCIFSGEHHARTARHARRDALPIRRRVAAGH